MNHHKHPHHPPTPKKPLLDELNESLSHEKNRLRYYQLLSSLEFFNHRMNVVNEEIIKLMEYQNKLRDDRRIAPHMIDQVGGSILVVEHRIKQEESRLIKEGQELSRLRALRNGSPKPKVVSTKTSLSQELSLFGPAVAWATRTGKLDLLMNVHTPEGRKSLTVAFQAAGTPTSLPAPTLVERLANALPSSLPETLCSTDTENGGEA